MIRNPWPCLGSNLGADLFLTFWWQQKKSFRLNLTSAKYAAIAYPPSPPSSKCKTNLTFKWTVRNCSWSEKLLQLVILSTGFSQPGSRKSVEILNVKSLISKVRSKYAFIQKRFQQILENIRHFWGACMERLNIFGWEMSNIWLFTFYYFFSF